jgi:hypothetical protein
LTAYRVRFGTFQALAPENIDYFEYSASLYSWSFWCDWLREFHFQKLLLFIEYFFSTKSAKGLYTFSIIIVSFAAS